MGGDSWRRSERHALYEVRRGETWAINGDRPPAKFRREVRGNMFLDHAPDLIRLERSITEMKIQHSEIRQLKELVDVRSDVKFLMDNLTEVTKILTQQQAQINFLLHKFKEPEEKK